MFVLFDMFIVLGFTTAKFGIFAWLARVPTGSVDGNLGDYFCFDLFHLTPLVSPPKADALLSHQFLAAYELSAYLGNISLSVSSPLDSTKGSTGIWMVSLSIYGIALHQQQV